jgi:hypothetical protein
MVRNYYRRRLRVIVGSSASPYGFTLALGDALDSLHVECRSLRGGRGGSEGEVAHPWWGTLL